MALKISTEQINRRIKNCYPGAGKNWSRGLPNPKLMGSYWATQDDHFVKDTVKDKFKRYWIKP